MWTRWLVPDVAPLLVVVLLSAMPAAAQTTNAKYNPARTPDGQPDMQGFWEHSRSFAGSIECEYDINGTTGAHENFNPPTDDKPRVPRARREGPCGPDSSRFGNVALGLKIPLQGWARAKKDEMYRKIYAVGAVIESPFDLDPAARCLPNGLPRTHALVGPHQILQPPGHVVILDEQAHQHRSIPVDGRAHVGNGIRLWMGDPVGRWEGNTLVVETTNFNGKTWWDMAGSFHSDAQRTIERFTVVDADTISYEITLEDPAVLTSPFKGMSNTFKRGMVGHELLEEECLEGTRLENYGFK